MSSPDIKVIFLLSYDYEYIKNSLPCIYAEATKILVSIDVNRVSWAGNKYEFDETIIDWIREYDSESKIQFFEDNFFVPENTPMQNETRQRQLSADYLGKGGWTIQLDVDEYFIDFDKFVKLLISKNKYLVNPEKYPIAIAVNWLTLFKKDLNGYFFIDRTKTVLKIATNNPKYQYARNLFYKTYYTRFILIHQSWAREEKEIVLKVNNWGHKGDIINPDEYIEFWKSININNYKSVLNFSPFNPKSDFPCLGYIKCKTIAELIKNFKNIPFKLDRLYLAKKNLIQSLLCFDFLKAIHKYYVKLLSANSYNSSK
jgi:hypothetical protein